MEVVCDESDADKTVSSADSGLSSGDFTISTSFVVSRIGLDSSLFSVISVVCGDSVCSFFGGDFGRFILTFISEPELFMFFFFAVLNLAEVQQ